MVWLKNIRGFNTTLDEKSTCNLHIKLSKVEQTGKLNQPNSHQEKFFKNQVKMSYISSGKEFFQVRLKKSNY